MFARSLALGLLALGLLAAPAAAQSGTVGTDFLGTTNTDTLNTTLAVNGVGIRVSPPDIAAAVSPNYYVEFLNGTFTVWDKAGNLTTTGTNAGREPHSTFWANAGITGLRDTNLTDPRVIYDPTSQRWFAVEITKSLTSNQVLVARSDSADPTAGWKAVSYTGISGQFADFPTLGVNANGVFIGTNNFTSSSGSFTGVSLTTISKADLLQATPVLTRNTITDTGAVYGTTPVGVTNSSATSSQSYMLGAFSSAVTKTTITGVGPGSAGTFGTTADISHATLNGPPNATQPNGAPALDLIRNDTRQASLVTQVGDLIYTVRESSISPGTLASFHWLVLRASDNSLVAEGNITDPTLHFFTPSIAANAKGDVVIGFTASNGSTNPSAYAVVGSTGNFSSWTFGTPFQLAAGQGQYNFTGTTAAQRWGDYSTTVVDPADPGSFWTTQEYMSQNTDQSNWATRVSEVIPTKAGETRWTAALANGGSGSFGGANWTNGTPGASDHVIFSRWSPNSYTVNMPAGTTTNDRLSVRQTGAGTVTFNLASGQTWTLGNTDPTTPSLAVAEYQGTSNVKFAGGGTLNTVNTIVGGQAGGSGSLTMDGVTWSNTGSAYVGGNSAGAGGTGSLTLKNGATANVGTALIAYSGGTIALTDTASFANTPLVRLSGGTLNVSGVTGGANFSGGHFALASGQTLQGSGGTVNAGTVGLLARSGSAIAPGSGGTTTGVLTVNGDTSFSSGSTFAVAVNGTTPGTGYSRLAVVGAVSLGNATLSVQSLVGSTFSSTDQVFILVNDGLDSITGQFNGLNEAAFVTVGGYRAQISYLGNAEANLPAGGNDVMLYNFQPTPVPEPGAVLAVAAGGLLFAGLARRRMIRRGESVHPTLKG